MRVDFNEPTMTFSIWDRRDSRPISMLALKASRLGAAVPEISRTKETRAKVPSRKANLGKRLGNGRLSRPRETAQPDHAVILFVRQPTFELQEEIRPLPPRAPFPVPREVASTRDTMHTIQEDAVHIYLFTSHSARLDRKGVRLTIS